MSGTVEISNWALGHIGIGKSISSITEQSAEATACNRYFAMCRDSLACMNDWEYNRGRYELQEVDNFTLPGNNWTYAYAYPVNTLKLRGILNDAFRLPPEDQKVPYELYEDDDSERTIILTDKKNAVVEVTRLITNTERLPVLVAVALSWLLARHVSNPLRVGAEVNTRTENGFMNAIREAISFDAAQRQTDKQPDSQFVRVRS